MAENQQTPFYHRWWNNISASTDNALVGMTDALYDTRQTIGRSVSQMTGATEEQVKGALPYVAAGAVGLGGLLLAEPLGKAGKWVFSGVKWVVTGGGTKDNEGFLEKIPVLGYAFKGLGWVADTIGDWSGYILGGLAALLTFRIFQDRDKSPPENPSTGTAAVGTPPVTIPVKAGAVETKAPVRPADPPSPPAAAPPGGIKVDDYAALYEARAKALANGQTAISQALRPWMFYNNQLYENNMLYAASGWLWNGVPADMTLSDVQQTTLSNLSQTTGIQPNARKRLLDELTRMGLTAAEAASMIPSAPPLPMSPPGYPKLPTDLVRFAHQFQTYYGNDIIKVNNGDGVQVGMAFDDMSLTQQREFFDGAIEYARHRYVDIYNDDSLSDPEKDGNVRLLMGNDSGAPESRWAKYPCPEWAKHNLCNVSFLIDDGWANEKAKVKYSTDYLGRVHYHCNEFKALAEMNDDIFHFNTLAPSRLPGVPPPGHIEPDGQKDPAGWNSDYAHVDGDNCQFGQKLLDLRTEFDKDVAPAINQHMAYLRAQTDFNTGQVEPYVKAIHLSQTRLRVLQEHRLALVGSLTPGQGVQTITAVDLRNPTQGTGSPRYQLTGTFENNVFHVTGVLMAPDALPISLEKTIDIDLTHPGPATAPLAATPGITALIQRIDQERGVRPQASVTAPSAAPPGVQPVDEKKAKTESLHALFVDYQMACLFPGQSVCDATEMERRWQDYCDKCKVNEQDVKGLDQLKVDLRKRMRCATALVPAIWKHWTWRELHGDLVEEKLKVAMESLIDRSIEDDYFVKRNGQNITVKLWQTLDDPDQLELSPEVKRRVNSFLHIDKLLTGGEPVDLSCNAPHAANELHGHLVANGVTWPSSGDLIPSPPVVASAVSSGRKRAWAV